MLQIFVFLISFTNRLNLDLCGSLKFNRTSISNYFNFGHSCHTLGSFFLNSPCKYSRCLSIIKLVHWCCCSELIVHTNAGITVKCLLSDVWYFTFFQSIFSWVEITCVWVLNLCLNYQFLQQLTRSRTVYCITRCEKIIEHTGMVSSTYAKILKYLIQGMPTNIILQVFI